jgi:hypothetical protein
MKPRLTKKVLRGLCAIEAHISAGDAMSGDLAPDRADASAALKWIRDMIGYRFDPDRAPV